MASKRESTYYIYLFATSLSYSISSVHIHNKPIRRPKAQQPHKIFATSRIPCILNNASINLRETFLPVLSSGIKAGLILRFPLDDGFAGASNHLHALPRTLGLGSALSGGFWRPSPCE